MRKKTKSEGNNKKILIIATIIALLILLPIITYLIINKEPTVGVIIDRVVTEKEDCYALVQTYSHNEDIGRIVDEYVGSWHACESVGSGYCERLTFYPDGNFVYFPSQYDSTDGLLATDSIVQGIWGISSLENNSNHILHLASESDMDNIVDIEIGELEITGEDSPYTWQATLSNDTYWQLSPTTDLWNPRTGEQCL